ncbi:MAG: hypothetical protein MUF72_07690 [Elainella sp. Prado103]|nr:hypothetical protein [Elainella sp. Prado103]
MATSSRSHLPNRSHPYIAVLTLKRSIEVTEIETSSVEPHRESGVMVAMAVVAIGEIAVALLVGMAAVMMAAVVMAAVVMAAVVMAEIMSERTDEPLKMVISCSFPKRYG